MIIYQFYNMTMTSLPIMFFAQFDFEYLKDDPSKYAVNDRGQGPNTQPSLSSSMHKLTYIGALSFMEAKSDKPPLYLL